MLSMILSASVSNPCSEWVWEARPSLSKKGIIGYARGGVAMSRLRVLGGSSILLAKVRFNGASTIQSDKVGDLCMSADGTMSGDAGSGVTRGVGDEMIGMESVRNSWAGVLDMFIHRMMIVWRRGVGSL